MARIDSLARVEDGARLADDVEIGPFCTVGRDVELKERVRLISHVVINGHTSIGAGTVVHPFAVLGGAAQSLSYRGQPTRLVIGENNIIREGATISVGTVEGGGVTTIGDRGFFMGTCHIGHDCIIGNDVVLGNYATLGGHCVLGDFVFIGGLAGLHQFTHLGAHTLIGGVTGVRGDVIPFAKAAGGIARLAGVNTVGMRRRGFPAEEIKAVRQAYRMLFSGEGNQDGRVTALTETFPDSAAVRMIVDFVRGGRKRPLCHPGRSLD